MDRNYLLGQDGDKVKGSIGRVWVQLEKIDLTQFKRSFLFFEIRAVGSGMRTFPKARYQILDASDPERPWMPWLRRGFETTSDSGVRK